MGIQVPPSAPNTIMETPEELFARTISRNRISVDETIEVQRWVKSAYNEIEQLTALVAALEDQLQRCEDAFLQ